MTNENVILDKTPIGLEPRHIHQRKRLEAIKQAIMRNMEVGNQIPRVWVEEYNDLAFNLSK